MKKFPIRDGLRAWDYVLTVDSINNGISGVPLKDIIKNPDNEWVMKGDDGVGVPPGGTTGQILSKASGTDFDYEWTSAGGTPDWDDVTGKPSTFAPSAHTHVISDTTGLQTALDGKQATLVSATNIKTVNGNSLLGSGDLSISSGGGSVTSVALSAPTGLTVSGSPVTSSGTLALSYTAGYSIPTDANQSNWSTAYGWGDHGAEGYLLPAAIGVTVQGYNANTVIDSAYVHTDNNYNAAAASKLAGIAAGATVNSPDATLLARANHTGTQLAATISDFAASVAANAAVAANTAKVTNATHTGDVTGSGALTIANDVVTNAKLANMATASVKGRTTAGTGDPEDLSAAQVRTLLNVADGATANSSDATLLNRANHTGTQAQATVTNLVTDLVAKAPLASPAFTGTVTLPAGTAVNGVTLTTAGGTTNFLRADGTYAAPPAGGATNLTYTAATRVIASDTGADATLPLVSTSDAGLAPASGGGTTNFLRADGTWAAPAGVGGGASPILSWAI